MLDDQQIFSLFRASILVGSLSVSGSGKPKTKQQRQMQLVYSYICYNMLFFLPVKQKLGDFIRRIDYFNAKNGNDYENSEDNPSNQLIEIEKHCGDITFDELKVYFCLLLEFITVIEFTTYLHLVSSETAFLGRTFHFFFRELYIVSPKGRGFLIIIEQLFNVFYVRKHFRSL